MSHIVPLTLALSFTQVVHEAGHAVCGTVHAWNPLRMGLILLFPCIPGAFVVLPQEAVESEGEEETELNLNVTAARGSLSRRRLRTISAGVWHNALTAMVLALFLFSGLASVTHQAFWKDVNGMRVEKVDIVSSHERCRIPRRRSALTVRLSRQSSPLFEHMPIGTTIVSLDDLNLTDQSQSVLSSADRLASWQRFLLEDSSGERARLGWCVPSKVWQGEQSAVGTCALSTWLTLFWQLSSISAMLRSTEHKGEHHGSRPRVAMFPTSRRLGRSNRSVLQPGQSRVGKGRGREMHRDMHRRPRWPE